MNTNQKSISSHHLEPLLVSPSWIKRCLFRPFWLVRQTGAVGKRLIWFCTRRVLMSPVGPAEAAPQQKQPQILTGSLGPIIISSPCSELNSYNYCNQTWMILHSKICWMTGSCFWKARLGPFQDCFHSFSHLSCTTWFQLPWRRARRCKQPLALFGTHACLLLTSAVGRYQQPADCWEGLLALVCWAGRVRSWLRRPQGDHRTTIQPDLAFNTHICCYIKTTFIVNWSKCCSPLFMLC